MIENALIRQVLSLPELIEQQYNDLEPKARKPLLHRRSSASSVSSLPAAAIPMQQHWQQNTLLKCLPTFHVK